VRYTLPMNDIKATSTGNIYDLQAEMLKHEQVDCPLEHFFSDGAYARKLTIPAGVTLVGKKHKTRHMNFLMAGTVTVVTGNIKETLTAPYIYVAEPGSKRAIFAHTEAIWVNVHGTEETDLEKIEAQMIEHESLPKPTIAGLE